jgi:hypothetical protein
MQEAATEAMESALGTTRSDRIPIDTIQGGSWDCAALIV